MKVTPDDYGRRCQFDHFCKLVLYHEAVDYFRERKRQRGWETSFETLPLSELDTLCTIDQYPSDSFIFPAYGCELQISDGLVAAAFASLPESRLLGLWDFLYWLRLSAVCLESGRYLQGYSRPEPVGQWLK